jgi:UDP-N-acetylmuramate--alanine ligase
VLKSSYKRIHFVGAGGSGVSALAHLLLDMGYEVTGSDAKESAVTRELSESGATIWIGHNDRYARLADLVVTSTAIPESNPEVAYARSNGKPLLSRIDLLSYLTTRHESIVVSGSHGKSTTSSMVAMAFIAAGRDPTVVLGSVLKQGIGSARLGKSKLFICEGDESNNAILEFTPHVAVVTNIDCDHLDFHGSLSNLKDSFIRFLNSPSRKGFSVVCLDDENIRSIMGKLSRRLVSYGFHPDAHYRAEGRRLNAEGGLSFEVHHKDQGPLGQINLRLPGDHNIQNALATVAISHEMGLKLDTIAFSLENFPGVRRRYDVLYEKDVHVIDDFAHHPSEIHALLSSVREVHKGRIRAIFQPHRFTRSKYLAQQFPGAFLSADEIVLAPIYTAYEKPIACISLDYLNRFFQQQYDERRLHCLNDLAEITNYIYSSLKPGDVVLTIGAGNVNTIGCELAKRLRQRDVEESTEVDLARIAAGLNEPLLFDDN